MSARLSLPSLQRSGRRRAIAVAMVMASSGMLVACGDDSAGGAGGSSVVVLDDDKVKGALLTLENMPDGWAVNTDSDEDDDEDAPGCLAEFADLEELDSESEAEVDFEVDDDFGLPALFNGVASFESEREVVEAMDSLREALEDCDRVDYTDPDDDTRIVLDFDSDNEKSNSDVDDQFNLRATGTIASGFEFPFGPWFSVARVDNHITSVMITDLSEDTESMLDPYTGIAVNRLVAVINDEKPEATQGPAFGADGDAVEGGGEESGDGDGAAFEQLPSTAAPIRGGPASR